MSHHFSSETPTSISPEQALQRLIDGNRRFVDGRLEHPRQDAERRRETLERQQPFAVVLTCSDSRLPPEILFDQGIGDLFVIRNAGNVLDEVVEGSIEYAVEHLHASLVVVLGHSRCGALTAAVESADAGGKVGAVVRVLQPAVISARNLPGDPVLNAAIANVRLSAERLRGEPATLSGGLGASGLHVVGAVYRLETGEVEFLTD